MGKNRKERKDGDAKSPHSVATVCVSGLPYSFTNAQLEETFSDVGPVRRCFLITNKGTNEHRGFAYVIFALPEDVNRAIELKHGSTVGGRRITVEKAKHRPSLQERRTKAAEGISTQNDKETLIPETQSDKETLIPETKSDKETLIPEKKSDNETLIPETQRDKETLIPKTDDKKVPLPEKNIKKPIERKKPTKLHVDLPDKESCSDKQRVARTVIFGGLVNAEMAEVVHSRVKEVGTVCSVRYPLPKEELQQNGLTQDGCREEASAVLFTSVKSACAAVAKLHQTEIKGNLVWARQLGGEGSKAQKWKLIIRNVPFQAKPCDIKKIFSAVGFVWDVFIPKNSETGLAKGFAFVKFTCKKDAEKAIEEFNGHRFNKRPIAVDWAVPKNLYNGAADATTIASADGDNEGSDGESDNSSVDLEEVDDAVESHQPSGDDNDDGEDDDSNILTESDALDKDTGTEVNFEEEADVARKVLKNLLASSKGSVASHDGETEESDKTKLKDSSTTPVADSSGVSKPLTSSITSEVALREARVLKDLTRTIFIRNLPFDVTKEEVKQRFAVYGDVESLYMVLHGVTKRPVGTAFLTFKTADPSVAAISAANSASGDGVLLKGRKLDVHRAMDKKAAQELERKKAEEKNADHRNTYLAKEGLILDGTPAAEGVSAEDMNRRRRLAEQKEKKLASPNFHVSRTRLVIYNLPKSMNDRELRQLLVKAVTSRATQQKPILRQVKFLRSEKKGKVDHNNFSRGVAFVEFTEHDHALNALRELNNNPGTFGPQHRPIIEFAVDDVQKLKSRQAKQQRQQVKQRNETEQQQQSNGEEARAPDNNYKRRTREEGDNTGENASRFKRKRPQRPPRRGTKEEAKTNIAQVKDDAAAAEKKRARRTEEKPNPKKRKFVEDRGEESRNGQRKKNKKPHGQSKGKGGPAEARDKLDDLADRYISRRTSGQVKKWIPP